MASDEKSVSALIAASRGGAGGGGGADAQNPSSTQSASAPNAPEHELAQQPHAYGNALPKDIGDLVYGLAAKARYVGVGKRTTFTT